MPVWIEPILSAYFGGHGGSMPEQVFDNAPRLAWLCASVANIAGMPCDRAIDRAKNQVSLIFRILQSADNLPDRERLSVHQDCCAVA
jgi:hypothetical protein